ncbi:hypothetical protein [Streptomyces shenzhenensis]|uniref:Enoyl reductase n=1 Tax=Streptomyces shenzhenensis TaxID=943815 RepID=A0A3M0HYB5_9ACTN|nr:hypothetical protein [Streptomyces shenzhenensis]RMB81178.1 hypothetical protein CTZ28_35940 [Streptomyces shenzhenensis]
MSVAARSLAVLSLIGSVLVGAGPAVADNKIGGGAQTPAPSGETSGGVDGSTLNSQVGVIVYDRSKNGSGSSVGPVASATTWTPPACWYAPKYTPDQLKAHLEPIWAAESTGYEWDAQQRDRYVEGHPYTDFNKDKADDGYWWDSYVNRDFPPGWDKCKEPYFWVDKDDPPPADIQNAVTPRILGELAYNEIRVPTTKVNLAPADTTKVNLATWAWLDGAEFKPVSVTASIPVLGISATTTAEPVSLKIDPGTADAVTYPASGVCRISGGGIGEPYAKGKAERTPPCGVKYLRSSGDGSYQLRATVTWEIHWTGSDGDGGPLPDGTFGAPQDVVVQEIQAVNR